MVISILVLFISPKFLYAQSNCFETEYTSYQIPDSILIISSTIQINNIAGEELGYEIFDNVLKINECQEGEFLGFALIMFLKRLN